MTATQKLMRTPMPYLTVSACCRPTVAIDTTALLKLLAESKKTDSERPTLPCMQAVRP